MTRREELAESLAALGNRVANAAGAAGRNPDEVAILPVTKFHPASDAEILYHLGCRRFGESREPEASGKIAELASLADIHWHMIGRLQRNKVKSIVRWADTIESVDSPRLVAALDAATTAAVDSGVRSRGPAVLIQVSLDGDPDRGGVSSDEVMSLADLIADTPTLTLVGVMAVAPLGVDPRRGFAALVDIHERLLRGHPTARERSVGMSDDLEAAVEHGSTCVRVGTALLGPRPIISP